MVRYRLSQKDANGEIIIISPADFYGKMGGLKISDNSLYKYTGDEQDKAFGELAEFVVINKPDNQTIVLHLNAITNGLAQYGEITLRLTEDKSKYEICVSRETRPVLILSRTPA